MRYIYHNGPSKKQDGYIVTFKAHPSREVGKVQINRLTDDLSVCPMLGGRQGTGEGAPEGIYYRMRWSGQWRALGRGNFQIRLEQANRTLP